MEEICAIVGIDSNKYSTKKGIIDEQLLRNRNIIAHGERVRFSTKESIEIYEAVFPILNEFKNDILNKATLIDSKKLND